MYNSADAFLVTLYVTPPCLLFAPQEPQYQSKQTLAPLRKSALPDQTG
jgi:hypothetical protein